MATGAAAAAAAAAAEIKKGGRRTGLPPAPVEKSGPALRNAEMELRKCCNHPYLVDGVEDQVIPCAASGYLILRLVPPTCGLRRNR